MFLQWTLCKSRLRQSVVRLITLTTFVLWVPLASAAQDCQGKKLSINGNRLNFGQISPGQLGLSSNNLTLGASPAGFTQINGPRQIETQLDEAAYSGMPVWLTPELVSVNDWDWRCRMRTPVNSNNIVVNYQLSAASGQRGGLSTAGQFIPVTLETDISITPFNPQFVEVIGRIRAYPDLSNMTLAGDVEGTLQIEVFEK